MYGHQIFKYKGTLIEFLDESWTLDDPSPPPGTFCKQEEHVVGTSGHPRYLLTVKVSMILLDDWMILLHQQVTLRQQVRDTK